MNILFPTDFSKNSEVALQYAVDLAKSLDGKITLTHVYNVPTMEGVGMGSLSNFSGGPGDRLQEKVEKDIHKKSNEQLNDMIAKFKLDQGDYQCIALQGDITAQIDHLLKDNQYDLVVMAFRNEQSQQGIFFGGVANHLINTSNCPVIAVPPSAKYKSFKNIMYSTDLAHDEFGALNWLVSLAKPHDAAIKLVHIGDEDKEKSELVEGLCSSLSYEKINSEFVPGEDITKVILETVDRYGADMLAMTTHTTTLFQKMFHASHSAEILNRIFIPFIGFSDKINHNLEKWTNKMD